MKVSKLAVALALAGGLGSGVAQALGLGEVQLQSYLNEPLNAQISLPQSRGVSASDVFVNVAPESAYRRVGLNRDQFVSKLSFKVVTRSDGSLAVDVSSREPLREPYLNFLVELTWPNGRLLREYAMLVDPPVYAAETGVREPLLAASSGGNQPAARMNDATSRSSPYSDSRGAQRTAESVYGPTSESDTLWVIASEMRPDSRLSIQQVMLAIQDINPDAFISGNINRLKRGEELRVPTLAQIQSRTRDQAIEAVAAQNQASTAPAIADANTDLAPTQPAGSGDDRGELKLIVADTAVTQTDSEQPQTGSAGADGSGAGGVDAGSAVALEKLDSVRRENKELSERLDRLQEQLATLQRLLELKDNQLADRQQAGMNDGSDRAANAAPSADGDIAAADTESGQAEIMPAGSAVVQPVSETATPVVQPEPVAERGFLDNLFNSIMSNPIYQAVLGGGLLLLLLLLLLLARRKNRDQGVPEDDVALPAHTPDYAAAATAGVGSFDLAMDDEPETDDARHDVLTEVDSYLAYGQHEQAINALESAISREPSRSELRLKLLAVYADAKDRLAFERQYGELSALGDDDTMEQADRLLEELEKAEAAPSIDDLESELRSSSFAGSFAGPFAASVADSEGDTADESSAIGESKKRDAIDYDLTGIKTSRNSDNSDMREDSAAPADTDDFILSDDFARQFDDEKVVPLNKANSRAPAYDDNLSLDESFLDEFDAELDKNSDNFESTAKVLAEPDLHELDLDFSDDELVLEYLDDDDDISLEDLDTLGLAEEDLPITAQQGLDSTGAPKSATGPISAIDENDLGDDDDFDFLAGTDEAATKLDLARAYVEMGDADGARDILQEVELEGTDEQKDEAKELLKNLS